MSASLNFADLRRHGGLRIVRVFGAGRFERDQCDGKDNQDAGRPAGKVGATGLSVTMTGVAHGGLFCAGGRIAMDGLDTAKVRIP